MNPELVAMMITQLPNFAFATILALLLIYQTRKLLAMAQLILDRCVPDGDCIERVDSDV